ncbi:MAG: tryptophan 7-halogenase [Asticcacaulis sp.]
MPCGAASPTSRRAISPPRRSLKAAISAHSSWATAARVEGDLFIDATGSDSLLLGEQLGVGIDDWSAWFPGDRMLVTAAARMRTLPSYSQVRALRSGCLHVAPVQDSTGLAYTFAGGATDDEQAFRDLSVVAGMPMQPDATVSALRPGRRTLAWAGNCVALGEAACVFDPIDGPGLHSLQLGLAHLVSLFPVSRRCAVESAEYNRIMREALERFRDYQIAHYKLNRIYDEPLWDQLRDAKVPEALARKIDMFQARGTVTIYDEETFQADDWLSLFIGHGLTARTCDPLAEMAPQDDAIRHIQRLLSEIRQRVEGMDSHEAYIELFAAGDFAAQGGRSYTF